MKSRFTLQTAVIFSALLIYAASCPLPASAVENGIDRPALHHLTGSYSKALDASLPETYDLRDYGMVTSVKDQDTTGTCWAHAALASAESNMIKTGLADTVLNANHITGEIDLSETHLVWFGNCRYSTIASDPLYQKGNNKGLDGYLNDGSNASKATSVLGSWVGAQLEANAPPITDTRGISESERYTASAHLQNTDVLQSDDIYGIKLCLMEHGALSVSYYDDSAYYSESNYAYYYNIDPSDENYMDHGHAVTVIGWDDHFSKSNFDITPPEDGAWLCKNSWGTEWGNNGFFYISYFDTSINNFTSFQMESVSNYDAIYQYDNGLANSVYRNNSPGTAGANIFTPEKNENITAVSIRTSYPDTDYTISVYTDVDTSDANPMNGKLASRQSGNIPYEGYHTIQLETPVFAEKGKKFSVVIAYHKTGKNIGSIPYDMPSNRSGVSYLASYDPDTDTYTNWKEYYDDYTTNATANLCIKAFAKDGIIINESNFPYAPLRNFVGNADHDTDGNKILSTSEIDNITGITVTGKTTNTPTSLKGIEHLTSLERLTITDCSVVALDLNSNPLLMSNTFSCTGCGLTLETVSTEYLSSLNIDTSKILYISGAEISGSQIIPTDTTIQYTYDCGNRLTADFTITSQKIGNGSSSEIVYTLGDTDGNGTVDATDAARILTAAAELGVGAECSLNAEQQTAGNVNKDQELDASDASIILIYASATGSGTFSGSLEEYLNQDAG